MNKPLVSVVLTSYNQKKKLERAFNSLINQTYDNLEIIISDDCSTDGISQDYIKLLKSKYPEKVRIHLQEQNVGIPKNKNTGLRMTRGKYITYLDGDDFYYPQKIENEIKILEKNPDIDVVYSNFNIVNEDGRILHPWMTNKQKPPTGDIFLSIIKREFPYNAVYRFELAKRKVFEEINFYDESLIAFEDWDSRIRYSMTANIIFCDNIGSAYVRDPEGISQTLKKKRLIQEMKKVFDKNKALIYQKAEEKEAKKIIRDFYERLDLVLKKTELSRKKPIFYIKYTFNKIKLKFKSILNNI